MIEKKILLAYLRKGDFAHAGDIEAIDLVMSKFPKDPNRLLLDVGCGLGGTAHYVQEHQWGKVTGIDINEEVINHAKEHYPEIPFYQCDVLNCEGLFKDIKFDIVYLFNAFYSFLEPARSLEVLSHITKKNGSLVIFDYSSATPFTEQNPFTASGEQSFTPLPLADLESFLISCNWSLQATIDITKKFETWYNDILEHLEKDKINLIERFGEDAFNSIYLNFYRLLKLINCESLAGTIVYATRR